MKLFKKITTIVLALTMALCMTACGSKPRYGSDDGKVNVVTTIFPEYDWVREIVGQGAYSTDKSAMDQVDVTMLMDNGVDLHSYQPSAADIAKISTCDVFVYVGGESDAWVDDALAQAKNKDMVVIDLLDVLGDSVKEEEVVEGMQGEDEEEEVDNHDGDADSEEEDDHDDENHHHDEGEIEYDEHVWLSLKNAQVLVNSIKDAMVKVDPTNKTCYEANASSYNEKLSDLDTQYQNAVINGEKDTILFADRFPFRYMVEDYGLNYYAAFVGCSAETEASFETIVFLSGKVDELDLPAICTIEKSDQKIAETVRDNTKTKDQDIVPMDSLQSVTSSDVEAGATYYDKMADNLEVLKNVLGQN